jgi:hypothetical protein
MRQRITGWRRIYAPSFAGMRPAPKMHTAGRVLRRRQQSETRGDTKKNRIAWDELFAALRDVMLRHAAIRISAHCAGP